VRAEQHDEARARGGGEVLLVGDLVARLHDRGGDERGGAIELGGVLGPRRLLESVERGRPEHPEAPRVREVVVRRPAGELEQLVERLPVHGTGLVGLLRAARADQLVELHAR
jgi:hypothetical protein